MAWPTELPAVLDDPARRRRQRRARRRAVPPVMPRTATFLDLGAVAAAMDQVLDTGRRRRSAGSRRRSPRLGPRQLRAGPVEAIQPVVYRADMRGVAWILNEAEFRFYRSSAGPPLETDPPFATNATLAHEPTTTYSSPATWFISVSFFNGAIDSGFLPIGLNGETFVRLELVGGQVVNGPPLAPHLWAVVPAPGGDVRLTGVYFQTGALKATHWGISGIGQWIASTPFPPSPDNAQTFVPMGTGGIQVLDHTLDANLPHGTRVIMRLQTVRNDGTAETPIWVYSEGSETKEVVMLNAGPSVPLQAASLVGRLPEDA